MLEEADPFAKLLCQLDGLKTTVAEGRKSMRHQALINMGLLLEALAAVEAAEEDPSSSSGDMQMYSLRLSYSRAIGDQAAAYRTLARDEGPWTTPTK